MLDDVFLAAAFSASASDDWSQLKSAHAYMRRAQIDDGIAIYNEVIPNIMPYLYEPDRQYGWGYLSNDPDQPSLNWTCIYLSEYHINLRGWANWRYLANQVFCHPAYDTLADRCKSRLISTRGWALFRSPGITLNQIIDEQQAALNILRLEPFEAAHHCMVIAYAYRMLEDKKSALTYNLQAERYIPMDMNEPYYGARARMYTGGTYYAVGEYDTAIAMWQEVETFIATLGFSAEPEAQPNSLGWAYIGNNQLGLAKASFQRGLTNALKHGMHYDVALNTYALGQVHFSAGNLDEAAELLQKALGQFRQTARYVAYTAYEPDPTSVTLAAICLGILAEIYARFNKKALAAETVLASIDLYHYVDDPVRLRIALKYARWVVVEYDLPDIQNQLQL